MQAMTRPDSADLIDSPSRVARREEAGAKKGSRKCPKCGEWKFLTIRYHSTLDVLQNKCTTCLYGWDEQPADKKQLEQGI